MTKVSGNRSGRRILFIQNIGDKTRGGPAGDEILPDVVLISFLYRHFLFILRTDVSSCHREKAGLIIAAVLLGSRLGFELRAAGKKLSDHEGQSEAGGHSKIRSHFLKETPGGRQLRLPAVRDF